MIYKKRTKEEIMRCCVVSDAYNPNTWQDSQVTLHYTASLR